METEQMRQVAQIGEEVTVSFTGILEAIDIRDGKPYYQIKQKTGSVFWSNEAKVFEEAIQK